MGHKDKHPLPDRDKLLPALASLGGEDVSGLGRGTKLRQEI